MPVTWTMPYRIETTRLILRPYEPADAAALTHMIERSREHLERYLPWSRVSETVDQREAWIRGRRAAYEAGEDFTLGIFSREDGRLVGGTGFHPRVSPAHLEIGFLLAQWEQGRGYVTESSAALTWIALTLCGSPFVAITHAPSNTASAGVPRRLGYVPQVEPGAECTDGEGMVASRVWIADPDTLRREPLEAFPRPVAYDEHGAVMPWPGRESPVT